MRYWDGARIDANRPDLSQLTKLSNIKKNIFATNTRLPYVDISLQSNAIAKNANTALKLARTRRMISLY